MCVCVYALTCLCIYTYMYVHVIYIYMYVCIHIQNAHQNPFAVKNSFDHVDDKTNNNQCPHHDHQPLFVCIYMNIYT